MNHSKNMPPYPTQRRIALDLARKKYLLISNIYFMEKSMIGGDFHNFASLTLAKRELRRINEKLSGETMKNYLKSVI